MIRRLRSAETVFKLCVLAFILLLVWTARSYPEKSRLFPQLLGSVTILLILISLVQGLIRPKGAVREEETRVPETPSSDVRAEKLRFVKELEEKGEGDAGYELLEKSLRRKRLIQSIVIILVSLGIGYLGGFLLTAPFFFIAFGLLHGQKKHALRYVVIAIGIIVLISFSPVLAEFALKFDPAEYFLVAVFALSIVAAVIKGATLKGLISAGLGLMLSTVGYDVIAGHQLMQRYG